MRCCYIFKKIVLELSSTSIYFPIFPLLYDHFSYLSVSHYDRQGSYIQSRVPTRSRLSRVPTGSRQDHGISGSRSTWVSTMIFTVRSHKDHRISTHYSRKHHENSTVDSRKDHAKITEQLNHVMADSREY